MYNCDKLTCIEPSTRMVVQRTTGSESTGNVYTALETQFSNFIPVTMISVACLPTLNPKLPSCEGAVNDSSITAATTTSDCEVGNKINIYKTKVTIYEECFCLKHDDSVGANIFLQSMKFALSDQAYTIVAH